MKASHQIHPDPGYVAVTIEGPVTLPELGAHIETVWSDPAWKSSYNGLIDFSAATLELSNAEMQAMTASMSKDPRCSLGRWALVVSTSASFAKLRQADHVADPKATLRIFFDRGSAETWLFAPNATKPSPLKR